MKTIEELYEEIEAAVIEFQFESLRGNHAKNWHALRVWPDGKISVIEEVSQSIPESEYFGHHPHPFTFLVEGGNCFSPEAHSGWAWVEDENGTRIGDFEKARYNIFNDLSEEEVEKRLMVGWKRFSLDLTDWTEYQPICQQGILDDVEKWAANNFFPA